MTKQQFYVVLGYNVVLKWGCLDLPCSSKYRAFSLSPEEHGKSRLYCILLYMYYILCYVVYIII